MVVSKNFYVELKIMSKTKFNLRDLLITLLFLIVIAQGWIMYQYVKNQDITNSNNASAWLRTQQQIQKLKQCVDTNQSPCEINF